MTKDEQYSYIFLLAFALIFLIWIVPDQIIAGENASVSPRLLPQLLAGGIGLISAVQLGRSVINRQIVRQEFTIRWKNYRTLFGIAIILTVIGMIINAAPTLYVNGIAVGRFWIGATLLVPTLLLVGGVRGWWQVPLYTLLLIITAFFFTYVTGIYIA